MNVTGNNHISAELEKEVLERFFNQGETNISKLARELNLARGTIYRIVRNDPEAYQQAIKRAREEAAERRKQQQRQSAKKCMQRKRAEQRKRNEQEQGQESETERLFWELKSILDSWGPHTEYEVAKRFNMDVAEVIRILRTSEKYRKLEKLRKEMNL